MASNRFRCNGWVSNTLAVILLLALASSQAVGETDRDFDRSVRCLAANIYHEARGESYTGQVAVANVVMNRVQSKRWPNTVCGVVFQRYQFSWTIRKHPDINDEDAYVIASYVAALAVTGKLKSVVGGSNHYHADTIDTPYWAVGMEVVAKIGAHTFYVD